MPLWLTRSLSHSLTHSVARSCSCLESAIFNARPPTPCNQPNEKQRKQQKKNNAEDTNMEFECTGNWELKAHSAHNFTYNSNSHVIVFCKELKFIACVFWDLARVLLMPLQRLLLSSPLAASLPPSVWHTKCVYILFAAVLFFPPVHINSSIWIEYHWWNGCIFFGSLSYGFYKIWGGGCTTNKKRFGAHKDRFLD